MVRPLRVIHHSHRVVAHLRPLPARSAQQGDELTISQTRSPRPCRDVQHQSVDDIDRLRRFAPHSELVGALCNYFGHVFREWGSS